jgi:Holliday junction DNA helicase RuvA
MLSAMSAAELKMHVEQDSEAALTRIPGIGKKTAQRLLIELKDKLKNIEVDSSHLEFAMQPESISAEGSIIAEVEGALISLGYKEKEAQQAIKAAKSNGETFADIQSLLKATLQQFQSFK